MKKRSGVPPALPQPQTQSPPWEGKPHRVLQIGFRALVGTLDEKGRIVRADWTNEVALMEAAVPPEILEELRRFGLEPQ